METAPFHWKKNRWAVRIDGQIYSATGVLFYTDHHLLLQRSRHRGWENFGGKVDATDRDIIDTASREVAEESNGLLFGHDIQSSKQAIRDQIIHNGMAIRFPEIKYILFLVKLPETFRKELDLKKFGNIETHTGIQRYVAWFKTSDLIRCLEQYRIKSSILIRHQSFRDILYSF